MWRSSRIEALLKQDFVENLEEQQRYSQHHATPGWFNIHNYQTGLLQKKGPSIIIIGNLIAACHRRYRHVWRRYFLKKINLGVGGDRVQHVLWRASNIDLLNSTQIALLQFGTNNTDRNEPSTFANIGFDFRFANLHCQEMVYVEFLTDFSFYLSKGVFPKTYVMIACF